MDTLLSLLVFFVLAILVVVFCLFKAIYHAKQAALGTLSGIREHKKWINRFLWALVPPVLIIETMVKLHGGRWGNPSLFIVHMALVALFVLTVISMRVIWTGVKNPTVHRKLSKLFYVSFVAMTCTGSALIGQLFMSH
jgi:uncharacterized membrane protein